MSTPTTGGADVGLADLVGDELGADEVGTFDGFEDGLNDGLVDGTVVGTDEGFVDGTVDGTDEGLTVEMGQSAPGGSATSVIELIIVWSPASTTGKTVQSFVNSNDQVARIN
mmetsp:Transcript_5793/g.12057  ORF Transcript_5793/g.12057 Transcript_5793/m.12057 type:complete len:112 (+) Transcript_5793:1481-1816(+)|eukprot:CAMPEP_0168838046 /NCGR_PEP_ID=MMETSP0727-20121128/5440_1 /TAXON_ID=265536 /ORGANISM="Amphiprora sp., Strain CCMP467" /LENGTH=111 /DNA_ID=CAMNT_0008891487 /DNA_START=417 /DNA_END=752 /DNA_ORIENTATION=+